MGSYCSDTKDEEDRRVNRDVDQSKPLLESNPKDSLPENDDLKIDKSGKKEENDKTDESDTRLLEENDKLDQNNTNEEHDKREESDNREESDKREESNKREESDKRVESNKSDERVESDENEEMDELDLMEAWENAINEGDQNLAMTLLTDHSDELLDHEFSDGDSALHICAKQGNLKLINGLFEFGDDLSKKNPKNGNTALHYVVKEPFKPEKKLKLALFLIKKTRGKITEIKNNNNELPYDIVKQTDDDDLIEALKPEGEDDTLDEILRGGKPKVDLKEDYNKNNNSRSIEEMIEDSLILTETKIPPNLNLIKKDENKEKEETQPETEERKTEEPKKEPKNEPKNQEVKNDLQNKEEPKKFATTKEQMQEETQFKPLETKKN